MMNRARGETRSTTASVAIEKGGFVEEEAAIDPHLPVRVLQPLEAVVGTS